MKQLTIAFVLSLLSLNIAYAGGETKKVCHKETKKGKEVEVCKDIKVHKKLDGNPVPEKKK
jgi:hypothetical protein